jgi:hypothetical protein
VKPWGIAFGDETQSIGNSGYGVCTILMNGLRKKRENLFEVLMSGLFFVKMPQCIMWDMVSVFREQYVKLLNVK